MAYLDFLLLLQAGRALFHPALQDGESLQEQQAPLGCLCPFLQLLTQENGPEFLKKPLQDLEGEQGFKISHSPGGPLPL